MAFLAVGLGGALGAACRYAMSFLPLKSAFPWTTFLVNLIGAVAIGFISGALSGASKNLVLFAKVGVCGGFTTFSTFSLEAYDMFAARQYAAGFFYIGISAACCVIGVWCGRRLADLL